jgi:chromosome transmission fidelity protein 1
LLVVPYQALFHAETREAFGLKVRGNIVVVDEAHNLIEAINSMHSIYVPASVVERNLSFFLVLV